MSNLTELLTNCDAHGIRVLAGDGDGLVVDAPEGALTPELVERIKAHKGELLAALRTDVDEQNASAVWDAAVDPIGDDGWPMNSIDAHDLDACDKCGSLELWRSVTGKWRCLICDSPAMTTEELKEKASRLQNGRVGLRMASARA